MNKLRKLKKSTTNSPVLFDDDEVGSSSPDEVRQTMKAATPRSKSHSGHSTPIRNRIKTDASDSPELNYNESPIEPLTQHPPSEVGWDYQQPFMKEDGGGNFASAMDISRTPKRNAALLSKKRNSNSPLLHKPLKKKLIQDEQQESMAGFMEELRAIEMKAKQSGDKMSSEEHKDENKAESQVVVEMNSEPSGDSDIKLQVSAEESPGRKRAAAIRAAIEKNTEDLLNDSIEDMLIQCSQQVEAEEFGINNVPGVAQSSVNTWRQPVASQVSNGKVVPLKCPSKENKKPLNVNDKTKTHNLSDENSSSGKGDSNSLEIPDDSFDEFMVEFNEDFSTNTKTKVVVPSVNNASSMNSGSSVTTTKNYASQNKFFQHKNASCIKQTKIITSRLNCNSSETSSASIQNKVMNANANFGYLNQNYAKNTNSSGYISQTETSSSGDKNIETRLFKSKSYSDSSFNKTSSNHSTMAPTNQKKPENKQQPVDKSKSSTSSDSKVWRRVQSSSSLSETNNCINKNHQLNVGKMSNSEGSLPLSTPAEIEKKRQEAIMKREAKLKMRLNNVTQNRPMPNSLKR